MGGQDEAVPVPRVAAAFDERRALPRSRFRQSSSSYSEAPGAADDEAGAGAGGGAELLVLWALWKRGWVIGERFDVKSTHARGNGQAIDGMRSRFRKKTFSSCCFEPLLSFLKQFLINLLRGTTVNGTYGIHKNLYT